MKSVFLRSLLLTVLAAAGCGKPAERFGAEHAMAWVNGVPITHADLQVAMQKARHGENESGDMAAVAQATLENLIRKEVVRQKAVEAGLAKDKELSERLAMADAQFMDAQRGALADAYVTKEIIAKVKVDEGDIDRYLAEHAGELKREYDLQQILFKKDESGALQAKAELDAGKSFDDVGAARFPGLPKDAPKPWDLKKVRWVQLPAEWRATVDKMQPGEVSGVLRGEGERFWIVKMIAKNTLDHVDVEAEKKLLEGQMQNEKARAAQTEKIEDLVKHARIKYGANP